jgi:hypothetical protein
MCSAVQSSYVHCSTVWSTLVHWCGRAVGKGRRIKGGQRQTEHDWRGQNTEHVTKQGYGGQIGQKTFARFLVCAIHIPSVGRGEDEDGLPLLGVSLGLGLQPLYEEQEGERPGPPAQHRALSRSLHHHLVTLLVPHHSSLRRHMPGAGSRPTDAGRSARARTWSAGGAGRGRISRCGRGAAPALVPGLSTWLSPDRTGDQH